MAAQAPTILAALAGVLAVGALLVRDPPTARRANVDLVALANEVERGADHMSVEELRVLASGQNTKLRIIDLRTPEEFAAGHVPNAENVPLAQIHTLAAKRDEPILLYSGGGIHSSQAWYLLRARGVRDVRFLIGGYDEWLRITAPPASAAPQAAAVASAPAATIAEVAAAAPTPPAAVGEAAKTKPRRQRHEEPHAAPVVAPAAAPAVAAAPKVREGC